MLLIGQIGSMETKLYRFEPMHCGVDLHKLKPLKNSAIVGHHADIIISDAPPTKFQLFLHKINIFKNQNKERKRVYQWLKRN